MPVKKTCSFYACGQQLPSNSISLFCPACRDKHPLKVLEVINRFKKPITEIIVSAARKFDTPQGMADYFGVSQIVLQNWIKQYFKLAYKQFKKKYMCSATGHACYVVEHGGAQNLKYVLINKLTSEGCSCVVDGSDNLIMTAVPPALISEVMHAEVVQDAETGIYKLRYPTHEPKPKTDQSTDTKYNWFSGAPNVKRKKRGRKAKPGNARKRRIFIPT